MKRFQIFKQGRIAAFLVEDEAYEGVKRVAGRVAEDLELVTGVLPVVIGKAGGENGNRLILAAVRGCSPLLDRLDREGRIDLSVLEGRRESYLWQLVENPFPEQPEIEELLVIAGSDKRGAIYGLFALSEHCGVSPLVYWGDVTPARREELELSLEEPFVSREPSVEYRGFFINDEWPAFGNWCDEHFGGVNAKAYEKVFELLLRLKGNYLWPAMWNSVFSEDGPGLENARLADVYGVIMGTSHHEPLCRAGAEWQRIYSEYGEDSSWNFASNGEAITAFWEDGLKRNREFENLITIGMRGENDSKLLSEDATLADNIEVIKNAIRAQHELIRKYVNSDLKQVPRMLAVYKEVEDYYYGSGDCPGLKEWEELDDVILMLCDDNFGNTRGLPTEGERKHPGGYGMYYHFDYHGGPISYEWQNSTRLTKAWEQLTQAYEFGVRRLWIVNVGDLKGNEYPLSYFMDLAYDYDKWGIQAPNRTGEYLEQWIDRQFGDRLNEEQKNDLKGIIDDWTKWSAARKPEAMNPGIYHPLHFEEGAHVWAAMMDLSIRVSMLRVSLPKDCVTAFESMIYYPAMAALNLISMQAEAGMNAWLAEQGSLRANFFGDCVKKKIAVDRKVVSDYHALADGKWNHMMDSAHMGFRSWNDYNWTYPAVREVFPTPGGRALVRFRGSGIYSLGEDWGGAVTLRNDDFTVPGTKEVVIDLDSRGEEGFSYELVCDAEWLAFSPREGYVDARKKGYASVSVSCSGDKLTGREQAEITLKLNFDNGRRDSCRLAIEADAQALAPGAAEKAHADAFREYQGRIVMEASHYHERSDVDGAGWRIIEHLGRMGDAVKAFPVTVSWMERPSRPWVAYDFIAEREGAYNLEIWCAARNPVQKGAPMRFAVSVNDGQPVTCDTVSEGFYTDSSSWEWSMGVLNNIRKTKAAVPVKQGRNRLYVYAGDCGIVLERIFLYPEGTELPQSYLGPAEV